MELLDKEETKAMCCFLLARCYQTRNPIPELVKNKYGYKEVKKVNYNGEEYSSFELYELRNPYLGQMKREFSNTQTYKEAYSQCNNLRQYLD